MPGSSPSTTIEMAHQRVGEQLGLSAWVTVDQAKVDAHARTTGDEDWLHNDPERAARESPYGGTIAQGSLILSMLVGFINEIAPLSDDIAYGLNYGFNKLRFVRPTRVGARVRGRMTLKDIQPKGPGRYLIIIDAVVEQEGETEPRLSAEWLTMVVQA